MTASEMIRLGLVCLLLFLYILYLSVFRPSCLFPFCLCIPRTSSGEFLMIDPRYTQILTNDQSEPEAMLSSLIMWHLMFLGPEPGEVIQLVWEWKHHGPVVYSTQN